VSIRMRFAALGVGTLVLVLGLFFMGIKPSTSKLAAVKDEVQTVRDEISTLRAELARRQALKRDEAKLRADLERLGKGLPEKPAVSEYIRQVQQIANEAGLEFLTITPGVPADTAAVPGLKSITLSMSTTGSFFDVEEFVSKMERLERAVRIDTFSLGGESPEPLNLSLSMQMFMQPPAAPAAATGATAGAPAGGAAASPAPTAAPSLN
jgi:Tfp pilus assembly protein PilO